MDTAQTLIAENAAFAALVHGADPALPVPTCPDWTIAQLMRHVGRGDRWSAQIVAEQSMEFVDPRAVPDSKPAGGPDSEVTWLHEGVRALLEAVETTGPQTPVWTFLGPRPAWWWVRRRLHETAVHRADAAIALGVEFAIDPAVAADGITEYLERVVIRAEDTRTAGGDSPIFDGQTLHLHATDPGLHAEWTIFGRPDGIAFNHEHYRAGTALRGPARDLLLALVRRGSAGDLGLDVLGDRAVWDTWLDRTPF